MVTKEDAKKYLWELFTGKRKHRGAVAIIILAMLSIFAVGIAEIVFLPVMHKLAYEQDVWNSTQTDPKAKADRDIIYNSALSLPIFMIGAIVLWTYLAVSRRDSQDY
jgi:hypothetical protein